MTAVMSREGCLEEVTPELGSENGQDLERREGRERHHWF